MYGHCELNTGSDPEPSPLLLFLSSFSTVQRSAMDIVAHVGRQWWCRYHINRSWSQYITEAAHSEWNQTAVYLSQEPIMCAAGIIVCALRVCLRKAKKKKYVPVHSRKA